MDPASFAVGVVGLAGLFSSCVDAASRVQSYRSFKADSAALNAQFDAERLRLELWGARVGLKNLDVSFINSWVSNFLPEKSYQTDHPIHDAFQNQELCKIVENHLRLLKEICHEDGSNREPRARTESRNGLEIPKAFSISSKKKKVSWALLGKTERKEQVEQFSKLVQQLHNLVPVDIVDDNFPNTDRVSSADTLTEPNGISPEIADAITNTHRTTEAETRRDLNAWILGRASSSDPTEAYGDAVDRRLPGTCDWILDREMFVSWVTRGISTEAAKLLWINGPAGFGKTVLCARIIQYLSLAEDATVAHVFSDYANFRDDPYTAVRSWVAQLVTLNHHAFELAESKWEADSNQSAPKAVVMELFNSILQVVPRCFLVLDGLDECLASATTTPASKLLKDLDYASSGTTTKVLIVSRDEPDIRSAVSGLKYSESSVYRISSEDVSGDITLYSQKIINSKLSKLSLEFRDQLSKKMVDRCQGQFLWLRMQADSLRPGRNKRQLQRDIENMSLRIVDLYDRTWERILALEEWERHRTFSILRLVAFCGRPLTLKEIAEAVLVDMDAGDAAPDPVENDDFPVLELPEEIDDDYANGQVSELCGQLVEIRQPLSESLPEMRTIHLAHFTVKEYLIGKLPPQLPSHMETNLRSSNEELQNALLARVCLRYLGFPSVWGELPLLTEDTSFVAAFRSYAASTWHHHIKASTNASQVDVLGLTMGFLCKNHPSWEAWSTWFDSEEDRWAHPGNTWLPSCRPLSPLYYAVRLNLYSAALRMIEEIQWDDYQKRCQGSVALYTACQENNIPVIKALLDIGCDVNSANSEGLTPLHISCVFGYLEAVRLLLDSGARHDIRDYSGTTPVFMACIHDKPAILSLLLERGADISARDNTGWAPIFAAAHSGKTVMAKMLLDNGADLEIQTSLGWTPLNLAAYGGFTEIVGLFLEKNADINVANNEGWTPICSAACQDRPEIIEALLDKGASPNDQTADGRTPLNVTADLGFTDSARLLLSRAADTSIAEVHGNVPLSTAARTGNLGVVKVLLEGGASVDPLNNTRTSPLSAAARYGHEKIVQLLLDEGADVTITDSRGMQPVVVASLYGQTRIARLLLERDPMPVLAEQRALVKAIWGGHVETIKMLLSEGAETILSRGPGLNQLASPGVRREPLMVAVEAGREYVVRMLLEYGGCSVESPDNQGWTPLFAAVRDGHVNVVQVLLDYASNDHLRSKCFGRGLLSWARGCSDEMAMCQLLIDEAEKRDVDMDADDSNNRPPAGVIFMCGST